MALQRRKPLYWISSSHKDLKAMPVPVQKKFGTALLDVQYGDTPVDAKPLKGFGGAGVLEMIEDYQTDTHRAVYTVDFPGLSTSCTSFRRRPSVESRRPSGKLTW